MGEASKGCWQTTQTRRKKMNSQIQKNSHLTKAALKHTPVTPRKEEKALPETSFEVSKARYSKRADQIEFEQHSIHYNLVVEAELLALQIPTNLKHQPLFEAVSCIAYMQEDEMLQVPSNTLVAEVLDKAQDALNRAHETPGVMEFVATLQKLLQGTAKPASLATFAKTVLNPANLYSSL
jgi:hypothetical protein